MYIPIGPGNTVFYQVSRVSSQPLWPDGVPFHGEATLDGLYLAIGGAFLMAGRNVGE